MDTSRPIARILAMGSFLPEKVLTNKDLEKIVDTTDEWITSRTGIKERRIAADDEFTSSMGVIAGRKALEQAQMSPEDLDLVICATTTPDYIMPSTGAVIQGELGAINAGACDIAAACTGHLYALSAAKAYIESGMYKRILVVSTEKLTSFLDYTDRSTCILFGDGASAWLISDEGPGFEIGPCVIKADGTRAEQLIIPSGGTRIRTTEETLKEGKQYLFMEGREVFKHAVRRMIEASTECVEKAGLTFDDVDWLVPHQANLRIIESIMKRCEIPDEKVYRTAVTRYGNQSSASLAIAFEDLLGETDIQEGGNILLCAFGAGFTWGAALLKKIS